MNIALAHFRVGETDGVSLEMEKWRKELEEMGHNVIYISGTDNYGEVCIPEINLRRMEFKKWEKNAYVNLEDYENERDFEADVLKETDIIEKKLRKVVEKYHLDMIIPNNIFSLGVGYPVSKAFKNVIEEYGLKVISHNHDFYWERPYFANPTCDLVKRWQDELFPPHGKNYQQVVINKIAQKNLKSRKNLDSTVVPNVFDFHEAVWEIDDYNFDFRKNLGLSESDIVFLQATRVSERKAIELAVEVIGEIQRRKDELLGTLYNGKKFEKENRIVLLMPGMIESLGGYTDFLKDVAKNEKVEILWINEIMDFKRFYRNGKKVYSLWDTYVNSDFLYLSLRNQVRMA
ncbi:MAG: glycosyl transferase family 1 [Candidatus Moranbacteria bacterium]|nr:glycosyl transferase family 1 [Candidatus Moranbacteria bacterium]